MKATVPALKRWAIFVHRCSIAENMDAKPIPSPVGYHEIRLILIHLQAKSPQAAQARCPCYAANE